MGFVPSATGSRVWRPPSPPASCCACWVFWCYGVGSQSTHKSEQKPFRNKRRVVVPFDNYARYRIIMRRAKREAFFFLVFRGKKSLFRTGHARRVGCLFSFFSVCFFVSVNIVIGHLGRPRSTHTAPMPAPMGSVHPQLITKPFRAGLAVSRSEFLEAGSATCVARGLSGPCLNSLEHTYQLQVPARYNTTYTIRNNFLLECLR